MVLGLGGPTGCTFAAYGLGWQSDFACHGVRLLPNDHRLDVHVSVGSTPKSLGDHAFVGAKFEARPGSLLLKTWSIADYLVSSGNRIRVEPKPGSTAPAVQNLLFGWAAAGLLQQRGVLPLHAAGVAAQSSAFAFCGDSGVGKSTLIASLVRRGLPVIDDNLLAVSIGGGEVSVAPGVGHIRLMDDGVTRMGRDTSDLPRIDLARGSHGKYVLALEPAQLQDESTELERIYVLQRGAEQRRRRLSGREKLEQVLANIFMIRFAKGLATTTDIHRQLLTLCARTEVVELTVSHQRGPDFVADELFRELTG